MLPRRTLRDFRYVALSFVLSVVGCGAGGGADSDRPLSGPATVAEAAQFLDLETFPVLPSAEKVNSRLLANLSYSAPGDVKSAFDFQRKALAERHWKELPNGSVNDQAASSTFARNGFTVSVSVYPSGAPNQVSVTLTNLGNVALEKLPVPTGAKPLYAFPAAVAYTTDASVESVASDCAKALAAQGWEPYGKAGDAFFFKRNAVRLQARIASAPAQGNKTALTYSEELLSADLPAPENAIDVRYADVTKTLSFDSPGPRDAIFSFYRKKLAETKWEATTDNSISIDRKFIMIFRNPAKDMLTLETIPVDDIFRVALKHQSAAEVAELDRRLDEQMRKKKEEQAKKQP